MEAERDGEASDWMPHCEDRSDATTDEETDGLATDRDEGMDPMDPSRMVLTPEERQWALSIKAAIVGDPEVDNLSDFEYAQLALMDHGDVEAAVERARHMQTFKHEYGITDTLEQSRQLLPKLVKLLPGMPLSLSYNRRDGE